MKKSSLYFILLLVFLLSASSFLFVACDGNTEPQITTENLTPQQQVDIAIESLTAMRDACLKENSIATTFKSLTAVSSSSNSTDLEDLYAMLDKNKSTFNPTDETSRSSIWAAFSIALLDALQEHGADCFDYDIAPSYVFTGGDSSYAQSLKEFFPTKIRFLGTKNEDGKNVIYASILISLEDVGDTLTYWYDLKTYYTDDEHFGYSLLRAPIVYPEYDYRSGDLFSYYDKAEPQRFVEIEAEKMQGQCQGTIQYADTLCNELSSFPQEDLQIMYDFLDDLHASFPKSDTRETLSSSFSVNLDDVANMR